ncbi:MAG: hypothetical protein WAK54_06720 [Bradyrhizobium sp.]
MIELCKELGDGLAFDNGRLLVGKFQQDGDNMFAISAPIVGAGALRIRNAITVQPDRNLVGLEFAALDFRSQSVTALKQVGYGSIVKVAPAARKGFDARERTNRLFRDAWFRDLAGVPSRAHVDGNLQIGFKFSGLESRIDCKQVSKQSLGLLQPFVCQNH